MLVYLAMIGAVPANEQPILHSPAFQCTPTAYHTKSGSIVCQEGFEIALWGLTILRPSRLGLTPTKYLALLSSSFRATEVHPRGSGYLEIIGAPVMECHRGKHRVAQCFVKGIGVLGGEDLACILLRSKLTKPKKFAKDVYSICTIGEPRIERGTSDVIKDNS